MIIEFDIRIDWIRTIADSLNQELGYRIYAAAPLPNMLILVMQEEITREIPSPYDLHGRDGEPSPKYDCLLGYHEAESPAGYTLAEAVGYRHSKISVIGRVADAAVADVKLSEVLAKSPILDWKMKRDLGELETLRIMLPAGMIGLIRKRAHAHFSDAGTMSVNSLVWTAVQEYLENL